MDTFIVHRKIVFASTKKAVFQTGNRPGLPNENQNKPEQELSGHESADKLIPPGKPLSGIWLLFRAVRYSTTCWNWRGNNLISINP